MVVIETGLVLEKAAPSTLVWYVSPLPEIWTLAESLHQPFTFGWLPWREAAAKCFSWSNRDAIVMLGER